LKKKILLIGGGGYIGSVAVNYLLNKNYQVICYDDFIYNHDYILKNISKKKFTFIKSPLKTISNFKKLFNNLYGVIILASVVGDPITRKYPFFANEVNIKQTKKLINFLLNYQIKKIIFVSTCSNYGVTKDNVPVSESYKLNPKSIYAKNKVNIEKYLYSIRRKFKSEISILRFATAFGLSPRMRFDLTINEFVRDIFINKKITVFDHLTWRPYCHVRDFAKVIYSILHKDIKRKKFEIFNVGSSKNNYTKIMILEKIKKYIKRFNIIYKKNSSDPRDYRVNFDKVKKYYKLGSFISVDNGIKEIIGILKRRKYLSIGDYPDRLGNYKINEKS
jgi:nucleoside-diphosphate-sugar epimerase